MKIIRFFIGLGFLAGVLFTSCIKDAALNTEADIVSATIQNDDLLLLDKPVINDNTVSFRLKQFSGNYIFAPEFTLSLGATIEPESGTELDFINPQIYTVTSEDGAWKKEYTVSFVVDNSARHIYSFENVEVINTENPKGSYHEFFDYLPNMQTIKDWDSGNPGYNILAATLLEPEEELTPAFYPTAQIEDGYINKGVLMQTKKTGSLGEMFGSPLAAGNLFIGEFSFAVPAVKSIKLGQSYLNSTAPKLLKGFYKYQAGNEFIVNTSPSDLTKDTWDVYAILFEKNGEQNYLQGDHNFQDPRIVSIARVKEENRVETEQWTPFEIVFEYLDGKTFDADKEYMYTIVFTSSLEGDKFNGAVGSKLWIDEVELSAEE